MIRFATATPYMERPLPLCLRSGTSTLRTLSMTTIHPERPDSAAPDLLPADDILLRQEPDEEEDEEEDEDDRKKEIEDDDDDDDETADGYSE